MSTPKKSRAAEMAINPKELELLAAAWISCGDAVPKPDYTFVADFCGYKNAASASVMFGHLRRKLKDIADREGTTKAAATPAVGTPTAKKSSTKKRGADATTDETPAKRGRKKNAAVKLEPPASPTDDAGSPEPSGQPKFRTMQDLGLGHYFEPGDMDDEF